MSKSIFNAIFCGALFVTGLPTSWAQNSSLPLCAPSARTLDWHMCRNKEDLGGGLVIDHEYRNGVPFFASGRQYPEGTFSLVEKFSLSNELNLGPIDMRGGRVYIDMLGLNVSGAKRVFGVLFDFPYGYAMSKRTNMKSFLVKMTADCSAQKMLPTEVLSFYGVMGQGDPVSMGSPFGDQPYALTDFQKKIDAEGAFLTAATEIVSVFKNVMGSVCAPDIITQVNNARNGRQRIETQSNLPACPSSGYFHNCFGTTTFPSGNKHVGEYKDDQRNGQGTFTYANGNKYVGEFKDDDFNGQGTFTFANGDKYVGGYKDDQRNGQGIFYLANGSISQSGVWRDDKLVTSQYVDPNSFTRIAKGNSTPSAAEAQRQENERKAAQLEQDRKRLEEDKRQIALERDRLERQKVVQPQIAPDNRRRLALVIGNDNYSSMPRLSNAVNDSNSMNDALKQANFEVMHYKNLNKRGMEEALQNFTQKLGRDDVGLFYFAGHGVQANSKNFLIPVGENVKLSADVQFEGMDVNRVMASLQGSKNSLNIVVLDACRSSLPERGGMSRGLTVTEAPQGSIVAYATAPGKAASDGDVGNSPFTKNLVRVMQRKGLKIEDVFKEVRVAVSRETNGEQVPQEVSQLVDDFYFRP
jgi:hypothetical protein